MTLPEVFSVVAYCSSFTAAAIKGGVQRQQVGLSRELIAQPHHGTDVLGDFFKPWMVSLARFA